ncbi:hypothetical protein VE23_25075 [Paenibacillus sp. D9]|uniref:hypothetical protein n=1 Tax=Paenibacillus sp. D9 TaxID=665792 RepID=UPI00061DF944|nr:hypothetical protein [Paenibacillus sp. D9]KKC49568.1 hypothetical protein VE23_25075 [Paenibacillus sp. D9]
MSDFMPGANMRRPLPQQDRRPSWGSSGIAKYTINEYERQLAREGKYDMIPTAADRGIPYAPVEPRVFKEPPSSERTRRSPDKMPVITAEMLTADVEAGMSNVAIAKKYGVNDTAICHKLRNYGITAARKRKKLKAEKSQSQIDSGW